MGRGALICPSQNTRSTCCPPWTVTCLNCTKYWQRIRPDWYSVCDSPSQVGPWLFMKPWMVFISSLQARRVLAFARSPRSESYKSRRLFSACDGTAKEGEPL